MTNQMLEILGRIELLPPAEQDAIAERLRLELDGRDDERRRRAGLAAIDRMAELTKDWPTVDAVKVAQESRQELEQRHIG